MCSLLLTSIVVIGAGIVVLIAQRTEQNPSPSPLRQFKNR